jgi:SAM-dependent methyltransferase
MNGFTDHFQPSEWIPANPGEVNYCIQFPFLQGVMWVRQTAQPLVAGGTRWLDAGCGTGGLAESLAEMGARVWAVDHDWEMIETARKLHQSPHPPDHLFFLVSDCRQLPLSSASLDGVTACSLLGCLSKPHDFYREIARVLKPGGHAILTYTNRLSLLLRINAALDHAGGGRFQLYSHHGAVAALESTGFQIRQTCFYNFFLNPRGWLFPPFKLAFVLARRNFPFRRWLARNFLIVAQRQ